MTSSEKKYDITLPELKQFSLQKLYDYVENIIHYEDLEKLNAAINTARLGLYKISENINKYERLETTAKLQYERAFNREYVASTEKTETQKRIRASITCEEIENEYIMYQQIKNDLVRASHAMRIELQTLQSLSNNLRQQYKSDNM